MHRGIKRQPYAETAHDHLPRRLSAEKTIRMGMQIRI